MFIDMSAFELSFWRRVCLTIEIEKVLGTISLHVSFRVIPHEIGRVRQFALG